MASRPEVSVNVVTVLAALLGVLVAWRMGKRWRDRQDRRGDAVLKQVTEIEEKMEPPEGP